MDYRTCLKRYPDKDGRFESYDGTYLTEELKPVFEGINETYQTICRSSQFINELRRIRKEFQGRSTSAYRCERLSRKVGNCRIYLEREGLNHTNAHKLNRYVGERLLIKFTGKKRLIAETGAGQRGVALATTAVSFGLECEIHMGGVDVTEQTPNMTQIKILGAKMVPVSHGLKTLKEAVDSAFEPYAKSYKNSIYCIGSALGPHPFPLMVRDLQSVVGYKARDRFMEMTGMIPDVVTAYIGGGSNSTGMFIPFLDGPVDIMGVEPLGRGEGLNDHAAPMKYRERGVMHGFESIILKDTDGEPTPVYSIASGLGYPSVGPKYTSLYDLGRVQYETVDNEQAMGTFSKLSCLEGIIPAIESSHAVAYTTRKAKGMKQSPTLMCLGGRGDKGIDYVIEHYGYGEQFL